ncbi:sensor histidine kinase [Protofrankia symbiont of Coriaria myrtifolia]|uniref:sensor histidine kinase n=1 Tax=Protofrankia symbiont of Coriaria myrtifolia TaxID=1306540 RepID=UPI0010418C32|nr:ATP-binding protein [Protofrankia symbiont of Coriaria myrtifolia]
MSSAAPVPDRARRRHGGARAGRVRRVDLSDSGSRSAAVDPASVTSKIGEELLEWMPHGRGLPTEDWVARHRLLVWVLAVHLPAIVVYAWCQDFRIWQGLASTAPSAVLLGAAVMPGVRRLRALATSLGLLCSSVVFVHLSHGQTEVYFHFFVVVALIALYEDWTVYLLAIAFVFVANGVVGDQIVMAERTGSSWVFAAVSAAFICALAAAQMIFWHFNEQARRRAEHFRAQLYEGQQSLMARLEETDRIRSDLVATVSHEFRTPLTGIRGTLLTIKRRRDRMSPAQLDDMLDSAVSYSDRLSRLLENMLTAATATGTEENSVADLPEVVNEVLATLSYTPTTAANVTVDVPPNLPVRMARQALHQVVANLVDNALVHSWPGAPVRLIAGRVGDEVILRVRNPGPDLDPATIRQLFEPFTQRDGTATRETDGAGMGLYVVRRLVEVHGGRLRMASEDGEIIVEVDMWAAVPRQGAVDPRPSAGVRAAFDRSAVGARVPQRPTLPLAREFGRHTRQGLRPGENGRPGLRSGEDARLDLWSGENVRPGLRSGEDPEPGLRSSSGDDARSGPRAGEETRSRAAEESRSGLRAAPPLWSNRPRPIDRSG